MTDIPWNAGVCTKCFAKVEKVLKYRTEIASILEIFEVYMRQNSAKLPFTSDNIIRRARCIPVRQIDTDMSIRHVENTWLIKKICQIRSSTFRDVMFWAKCCSKQIYKLCLINFWRYIYQWYLFIERYGGIHILEFEARKKRVKDKFFSRLLNASDVHLAF